MSFIFKAKKTFRKIGDAHRDRGEWQEAATAYRRHLESDPSDVAIWVQLGHVEKEQQRIAEAEAAYEQAIALAPSGDTDAFLHLAHMLKLQSRHDDAFEAFSRLLRVSPEPGLMDELDCLARQRRTPAPVVAQPGAILFPMQDFFSSFMMHSTFTGMQRVQVGVAVAAMEDPAVDAHFILNGADENGHAVFVRLDEGALRDIIDYVGGNAIDHAVLLRLLKVAELGAVPILFGAGTTIVILGTFWDRETGAFRYLEAKRRGAWLVAYIHDIIPVTHAEHCDRNLSNAFWRALAEMFHVVDFVLTNSNHTQFELKRFVADQGGRAVPMRTVPLAHTVNGESGVRRAWPPALERIKGRRYVAYVSTVEGRKNHLYILHAWQRMIADNVDVPDLVFAGRLGWKMDMLANLLNDSGNLGGRVHLVHGLSDAELNGIYRNALFTVFTSLAEGWGLPVGESLTHGIPCVASGTTSIPEVGGEFVDYVDPENLDDGVRVLTRMIEDDAYRAKRQHQIRSSFQPRSWRDVGNDLLAKVKAMRVEHPHVVPVTPVTLSSGQVFRPATIVGKAQPVEGYFRSPMDLAIAPSFHGMEASGAWMRGAKGEITLQTDLPAGSEVVLLLAMRPAPWAVGTDFVLDISGSGHGLGRRLRLKPGRNLMRIEGPIAPDGSVTLFLGCSGQARTPSIDDLRSFVVSLDALGYAPVDNLGERTKLRENFLFS